MRVDTTDKGYDKIIIGFHGSRTHRRSKNHSIDLKCATFEAIILQALLLLSIAFTLLSIQRNNIRIMVRHSTAF